MKVKDLDMASMSLISCENQVISHEVAKKGSIHASEKKLDSSGSFTDMSAKTKRIDKARISKSSFMKSTRYFVHKALVCISDS